MSSSNEKLVSWLFETNALKVCPQDKPFWYTSGTIGPYYINTHFLYGSEEKANELLRVIDRALQNKYTCPSKIFEITKGNYNIDVIYKGLIDEMIHFIKDNIDINEVDCISGGERRDWFFSLLVADILEKPHITIFKDLKAVVTQNGKTEDFEDLNGKKILHIADLITEASSYDRAWIPAIKHRNGILKWSVVVVDRKQGGEELLQSNGVKSLSMVDIDRKLFEDALQMGLINNEQFKMIENYIENPKESMRNFLLNHQDFLKNALDSDDKTKERAKLCINRDVYNLGRNI